MKTYQKLSLCTLAVCALGIAGLAVTSEVPQAEADTQIPGYTKHCPIYYYGNLGGDLLYMTQNASHCGSDYVWTDAWADITFGAASCGWPIDCLDPIFVDEYGEVLSLNEAKQDDKNALVALKPIPETQKLPGESRLVTDIDQKDYIAPRFGAPGESRENSGKFVSASDKVSFTGDADFVVKVKFSEEDIRYFRVLELKLETENSADSEVVRIAKELDPNIDSNTIARYEASVVESNDKTHVLQLNNHPENHRFLATTVTPVIAE